ncbi:MAG: hypothetical protein A2284_18985 [Deltaproteobacteria bacterium RIFOXYA12_FULL_61_11]|nr:MAG: hypothetical protein A2284_18985 [Deltaproteobacteria bacterium RIFOXYA12_FULL_61_11]
MQPELLRRIKAIHLRAGHVVDDLLAGEYVSAFKGRGMEFEEVREYVAGDDIRTIDWNVTARTGLPHVKQYREERELTMLLMVDVSHSGQFGTVKEEKLDVAARLAAVLAYSAISNNDKVGLIVFSDQVELYVPPKKGKGHVFRVIKEVLQHRPRKQRTDLGVALGFLNRVTRRKAVVFLLSDFQTEGYETALRVAASKHDLIAVQLRDPRELELPALGLLELEDAETGEAVTVDTGDREVLRRYRELAKKDQLGLTTFLRSVGVDHIDVRTDRSELDPVIRFFRMRERRR